MGVKFSSLHFSPFDSVFTINISYLYNHIKFKYQWTNPNHRTTKYLSIGLAPCFKHWWQWPERLGMKGGKDSTTSQDKGEPISPRLDKLGNAKGTLTGRTTLQSPEVQKFINRQRRDFSWYKFSLIKRNSTDSIHTWR